MRPDNMYTITVKNSVEFSFSDTRYKNIAVATKAKINKCPLTFFPENASTKK